jgi:ribosomal protein L34
MTCIAGKQGSHEINMKKTGKSRSSGFRLRKATFKGRGMRPALRRANWDKIRDLIYRGRGS